ncbi:MAG TPA: glycosyltransferase family 87 protein, partial [Steroidobacteraceae bacterium]
MTRRLPVLFFAVTTAYVAAFAAMIAVHVWLWSGGGRLAVYDFVEVYAAGKLALAGHAAGVYDWATHRAAEAAALGHPVTWREYLGWHYPPPFLFLAMAFATLPYLAAFFAWNALTLPPYLFVMRRIAGRREAWLAAAAFPATFLNIAIGQNGFVSAALIGGALLTLETSPILSGVLIGLLTYKPQLGILFPFALAAGCYWRTAGVAAATAILMMLASLFAFGGDTWLAFFHSISVTTDAVLVRGLQGWGKLNSPFGVGRWLGLGFDAAAAIQIVVGTAMLVAIVALWRSKASLNLKAAALATASLLVTPYLYVYDLPILAVALAFLFRAAPFDRVEYACTGLAVIAIFLFPVLAAPTGVVAIALVAFVVA